MKTQKVLDVVEQRQNREIWRSE